MHCKFSLLALASYVLIPAHCRPQDTETSTASSRLLPTNDLLNNQNTATITGAALGVGIGVAGSILVGKLLDDASKCKPPAISKFLPLPDLLNLNNIVNPDCANTNKNFGFSNNYKYVDNNPYQYQQFPSPGYDVIPLASSNFPTSSVIQPTNVQLTPDNHQQSAPHHVHHHHFHQPTSGFTQTGSYTPSPNTATQSSQTVISAYNDDYEVVDDDDNSGGLYSFVPNQAIQPRNIPEAQLYSPVPESQLSNTAKFSESDALLFQSSLNAKNKQSLDFNHFFENQEGREGRVISPDTSLFDGASFSETEAVLPEPDEVDTFKALPESDHDVRNGRIVESGLKTSHSFSEPAVLFKPRPKKLREGRVIASSEFFTETEPVLAETNFDKNAKAKSSSKQISEAPVLFQPRPEVKKVREGRVLNSNSASENKGPKPFSFGVSAN